MTEADTPCLFRKMHFSVMWEILLSPQNLSRPLQRQLEKFPPTAAQGECFDLLLKLTVAKVR